MSAVTTWHLLPSIHAPLEGDRVLLVSGAIGQIFEPLAYVPEVPLWRVRLRCGLVTYVDPTNPQGYWREVA